MPGDARVMTTTARPITDDELPALFAGLEGTPLALAVSGGADSMALMHMAARWAARQDVRDAWAKQIEDRFEPRCDTDVSGPPIGMSVEVPPPRLDGMSRADELRQSGGPPHVVVLTVDHGLRKESASEAAFVAHAAAKLGLPCQVLCWESDKPVTGIQNAAREARRQLMLGALADERGRLGDIARRDGVRLVDLRRCLVMAHHMEDQAETFLMRLARGSGLDGLGGMRARDTVTRAGTPERPDHFTADVLRPLLEVPKARLVATLQAYGERWIEDPSNEDQRFERVRLRKALRLLQPLGLTADKIALSARRLDEARSALLALSADRQRAGFEDAGNGGLFAEIDLEAAEWLPWFAAPYAAARTLRHVIRCYGGATEDAELSQIEALERRLRGWREAGFGAEGVTLGGCKLELHGAGGRRCLRVYREGGGLGLPACPIEPGQAVDWDGGRFTVVAADAAPAGAVVRALGPQGWADLKRAVRGLGDLGWPAAAVSTVPVIEADGAIIAHPVIDAVIGRLSEEKQGVERRWAELSRRMPHAAAYGARFNQRAW